MMNTLLGMGLAGSAVFLVWCAIDKLRGGCLPARWHYRILKLSLFFMLVPMGRLFSLLAALRPIPTPAAVPAVTPPIPDLPTVTPILPPTPAVPLPETAAPAFSLSVDMLRLLAVLWAVGAAALLLRKAAAFYRFRRHVLQASRAVTDTEILQVFQACKAQLGIRSTVRVAKNPLLQTSLITGLLRPVIVLPAAALPPRELRYLFLHELTHVKSRDLWIRFFSLAALILHWYNPLMHLLNRKIKDVSEQNCDEQVAAPLSGGERYAYGSILLKLASSTAYPGEWAASLSAKETLERRLIRVLHPKHLTKAQKFLSLALAAAILVCGTAAALAARKPLIQQEADDSVQNIREENTALRELLSKQRDPNSPETTYETAVWFTPADIHDIESAELVWWNGTVYTPSDPAAPTYLESLLSEASPIPSAGCPVHSVLYLQRSDGVLGKVLPAEDSCAVFQSDGAYYDFSNVDNAELYTLFGVSTAELPQWTAADAIQQLKSSITCRDGIFSFTIPAGTVGWNIHIAGRLNAGGGMSVHYLDGEAWTPGKTYTFQTADGTYTELTMEITLGSQETSVDLAAYLLQEAPAPSAETDKTAVLYPDALRGNTALILSRGGTLLPDDDPRSYVSSVSADGSEVYYKQFIGKDGYRHKEYLVGNKEALLATETRTGAEERVDRWLSELVNGEYPKNKNGESYGIDSLADYVGYGPDLFGVMNPDTGVSGYVRRTDIPGENVKTPEEALAYMEWRKANPGPYQLPMYDAKGDQIGYWEMGGNDDSIDTTGMTIEEAKKAVAEAGATALYPDALRGDTNLILAHGGTLLPDNEESSYDIIDGVVYKLFLGKDGYLYDEYLVGNKDALNERRTKLLDTLVEGDYPKNSKGESYGDRDLTLYVGYQPDLLLSTGTNGESGYTRPADEVSPNLPAAECPHEFLIPLYDSEGNEIGKCELSCGGHMSETGMTIDEAKAAIANGAK